MTRAAPALLCLALGACRAPSPSERAAYYRLEVDQARATCMVAFADVAVSLDERTTEQCARLLEP